MSDKISLSSDQKQKLHDAVENAEFPSAPRLLMRENPHVRIYVAAFDGTWNDRENLPTNWKGEVTERQSLVAEFEASLPKNGAIKSDYFEGVGTRTNPLMAKIEGATGWGSLERAERAYKQFTEQVDKWRKEDPNIQVHVHTMSFSRGGGSAIHFLNMVDQQGARPLAGGEFDGKPVPPALAPGKISSSATLLDTVVTGQRDTLMLGLPASTLSVLQVTADLEVRRAFSFTDAKDPGRGHEIAHVIASDIKTDKGWNFISDSDGTIAVFAREGSTEQSARATETHSIYYQRIKTVELPGVHSDIGGTYRDGGIREVSKYIVESHHRNLGFPIAPERPEHSAVDKAFAHDSRWGLDKAVDFFVGDNTRGHFQGKVSGWDGTLAFDVSLGTEKVALPWQPGRPKEGLDFPAESFKKHETQISLNGDGIPTFSKSGSSAYQYDAAADRVTLHGQALDFLGGKADIAKQISANGGPLPLEVTPHKHLPSYLLDGPGSSSASGPIEPKTPFVLPASPVRADIESLSPEAKLNDVLTNGLRSMGKNEQVLTPQQLTTVVNAIATAEPGERLLVHNGQVELVGPEVKAPKGAALFDAIKLSDAVGFEINLQKNPTPQAPAAEAPQPGPAM